MKLLTIIVPTYNMQDYLHKCLASLLIRPDRMSKLEVLVINDGSQDDSSAIAHYYQRQYPGTFRVIDKENGNYGSCVNRGLSEAEGKYIKILDADDWFDNNSFELFLEKLEQYTVDLVISDYQTVNPDGQVLREIRNELDENVVFSFQDLSQPHYFSHHTVTYRTQFLRDLGYRQTEGIFYTDHEWVLCPQLYVKTAVYFNECVYKYLIGRIDQSSNPEVELKSCWHRIHLLKQLFLIPLECPEIDKSHYGYRNYESFINELSRGVYIDLLVNTPSHDFDSGLLTDFDETLFKCRPDIYVSVGRNLVLKVIPIHYVLFWRKYGRRFPVDWFRDIYRALKSKDYKCL